MLSQTKELTMRLGWSRGEVVVDALTVRRIVMERDV